jgi:hypothetical protein
MIVDDIDLGTKPPEITQARILPPGNSGLVSFNFRLFLQIL